MLFQKWLNNIESMNTLEQLGSLIFNGVTTLTLFTSVPSLTT